MDASRFLQQGLEHHRAGRTREAEVALRTAVELMPSSPEARWRLGLLLIETGRLEPAVEMLTIAARLAPGAAEIHNDLGIALARAGKSEPALAAFRRALQARPDHAGAYNNLANVLRRLGKAEEAERALMMAVCLDPAEPTASINLGGLWQQMGRTAEAAACFRNAARLDPNRGEAHYALGSLLADLGRIGEAVEPLSRAVALRPREPNWHNDLGNVLRQLDRVEDARASYEEAARLDPNEAAPLANLANLLAEDGRTAEARDAYRRAHRLRPSPRLRLLAETLLPVIHDSVDSLESSRAELEDTLRALHEDGVRVDPSRELMPTSFYLAYHGRDDRAIHESFARFGSGPRSLNVRPRRERPKTNGPLRIGFLSAYLRNHTIGQLNRGLVAKLDRSAFEVVVLTIGSPEDETARSIRASANRAVALPSRPQDAIRAVLDQDLDVLHFPDIGMDALTYTLAFHRLAPIRTVGWGHPVTTGLDTIDAFLSTADLEPPGSERQYTERLVRLPRLGVYYARPRPAWWGQTPPDVPDLPTNATLYGCPQTLFKFHPEFDPILAEILRRDPAGRLVLVEGKSAHWGERLRARFRRTMRDVADRIVWVRPRPREEFLTLLAACDVLLDPLHFGGGNTSYEALALGVPIVTWPSGMLRGRLTYAMYRRMGMTDLVADSAESYVRIANRLGRDRAERHVLRRRIVEQSDVLYNDTEAVRDFERAIFDLVER